VFVALLFPSNLFRGFGFKEVDKGHCFRREDTPPVTASPT